MARLQQTKVKDIDQKFLSVIFDPGFKRQSLKEEEKCQLEVFERGLASQLSTTDTIDKTIEKIVKMALACEFGASLLVNPGAKAMVSTISRGILSNSELRRSALIIADRFAKNPDIKEIKLRKRGLPACLPTGKTGRQGKTAING